MRFGIIKAALAALIGSAAFVLSTAAANAPEDSSGGQLLPLTVVPWEGVQDRTDSAEVVLICLVDEYSESRLKGAPSKKIPISSSKPVIVNTPAQVLHYYLNGVRQLARTGSSVADSAAESPRIKILLVEGKSKTREYAAEFFNQFGLKNYDRTIPVIFVFHRKELLDTYTYRKNPGENGVKLAEQVAELLKAK